MKQKIRPIYNELQGYLSQAPNVEKNGLVFEPSIWEQHNETIDELNKVSSKDYNRYKVEAKSTEWNGSFKLIMNTQSYRTKLSGLISRLHGEYFSNEQPPFSEMPNTVITQNQMQSQTIFVQVLLEFQSKIDEKLNEYKKDSKEKMFLEKLKSSLSGASNIVELFRLILKIGTDIGLTMNQISKLFS
ncbi:MAG: hypothetical protein KAT05_09625 [Spirochaetes bacterium]|nr:hypothetical protein [Spirochaetota bacterium]